MMFVTASNATHYILTYVEYDDSISGNNFRDKPITRIMTGRGILSMVRWVRPRRGRITLWVTRVCSSNDGISFSFSSSQLLTSLFHRLLYWFSLRSCIGFCRVRSMLMWFVGSPTAAVSSLPVWQFQEKSLYNSWVGSNRMLTHILLLVQRTFIHIANCSLENHVSSICVLHYYLQPPNWQSIDVLLTLIYTATNTQWWSKSFPYTSVRPSSNLSPANCPAGGLNVCINRGRIITAIITSGTFYVCAFSLLMIT